MRKKLAFKIKRTFTARVLEVLFGLILVGLLCTRYATYSRSEPEGALILALLVFVWWITFSYEIPALGPYRAFAGRMVTVFFPRVAMICLFAATFLYCVSQKNLAMLETCCKFVFLPLIIVDFLSAGPLPSALEAFLKQNQINLKLGVAEIELAPTELISIGSGVAESVGAIPQWTIKKEHRNNGDAPKYVPRQYWRAEALAAITENNLIPSITGIHTARYRHISEVDPTMAVRSMRPGLEIILRNVLMASKGTCYFASDSVEDLFKRIESNQDGLMSNEAFELFKVMFQVIDSADSGRAISKDDAIRCIDTADLLVGMYTHWLAVLREKKKLIRKGQQFSFGDKIECDDSKFEDIKKIHIRSGRSLE
jgi:hypothetical protein